MLKAKYKIPMSKMDIKSKSYSDNEIILELTMLDEIHNKSQEINNLIKNKEGDLIFSDDPNYYYIVKDINSDDITREFDWLGNCQLKFICSPHKYFLLGKEKIILTGNTTLTNLGNIEAEPVITVYGSGDIDLIVGQQVIQLKGINGSITLDTPNLEAYKGGELENKKVNGEFLVLPEGTFSFNWSGNVTSIEIIPNWRCL